MTVEEYDFLAATDSKMGEEELNINFIFMAKIQEVVSDIDANSEPSYDIYALAEVQIVSNNECNLFVHQHPEQLESINDTYVCGSG